VLGTAGGVAWISRSPNAWSGIAVVLGTTARLRSARCSAARLRRRWSAAVRVFAAL
jgi:hypothetical protein